MFRYRSLTDNGRRAFLTGRWSSSPRIGKTCLGHRGVYCRACAEACESRAISFNKPGISAPVLNTGLCTACRDCVDACPVNAIHIHSMAVKK